MIEILALFIAAALLGAAWRLWDGGPYKKSPWTFLAGVAACLLAAYNIDWSRYWAAWPAAVAWLSLTRGYEDWNSAAAMLRKYAWVGPAAVLPILIPGMFWDGWPPAQDTALIYCAFPVAAALVRPPLQALNKPGDTGFWHWGRRAEMFEAALIVGGLTLI
ncbi:MAG: hypothetical protein WD407_08735 [Rhodospirillales bacterium]